MKNLFVKHDRWGHGFGLWILVAMVFLVPPAWWALGRIDMHNDVANWLPADDPRAVTLHWFQNQFGSEERLLLSWDSSSLSDPRLSEVVTALHGNTQESAVDAASGSPYLLRVSSPIDALKKIFKTDIEPDEAVDRLAGTIVGIGPLRLQLTDVGRSRLRTTKDLLIDLVAQEFGETAIIHEETQDQIAAARSLVLTIDEDKSVEIPPVRSDLTLSWPTMKIGSDKVESFRQKVSQLSANGKRLVSDCLLKPGSPVALSVVLSDAGRAERREAIDDIRQRCIGAGVPAEEIRMGGSPVAGNALNQAVKKAVWNRDAPPGDLFQRSPVLVSCLVGIVLSIVLLRSIRLVVLVQITAIYTMFLAVAVVPVTGGSMNMVVVVMPTLLMVLTLSAAIHVVNYWKHANVNDPSNAVEKAVAAARTPCTLAAFTTAIGLLSLTSSPLAPVRQIFGLYSAIGCAISLAVVLLGLPSMLQYCCDTRATTVREASDGRFWPAFGGFLIRRRTPVIATSLLAMVVCVTGLTRFQTEVKVIRYFQDDSRLVQDYNFLEQQLSGIIPVETVVKFDEQSQSEVPFLERQRIVQQVQENIRQHPEISGVISLATFLPAPAPPPKPEASRPMRMMYRKRSSETEERVKAEVGSVGQFLVQTSEATDLAADGDNGLNASGDELWRITAQVAIQSDLDYGEMTDDLNQRVASILRSTPGASHVVTGMVPVFLRTQQAVLESLITSFCLAFVLIAIVLMCVLRNPVAGLLTMLPNLLPVGVVFGAISWFGMRVDIGTMITASVALGVAVDGTLHLVTWYRQQLAAGRTQHESVCQALSHCGTALWQTSAVVGIGLMMLWPTELRLISRFGWVMAALIGVALIADLVLLPAMLAGRLGRLIERADSAKRHRVQVTAAANREAIPAPNVNRLPTDVSQVAQTD